MKRNTQLLGLTALVAVIMFGFIACDDDSPAAHKHKWGGWSVTTPATCIAEGEETRVCETNATHKETRVIPVDLVNGHDWGAWGDITKAATCTETGIGKRTCKLNIEHIETTIPIDLVNGHDWSEWTKTSDPTETENGVETQTCSRDASHFNEDSTRPLYATGTAGLEYEIIDNDGENDGTYRVSKGTFDGEELHIPAYWRPAGSTDFDDYKLVTEISNGTNSIYNNAFGTDGADDTVIALTAVTFAAESELKSIADYAFNQCRKLTSITIPDSVTTIGTAVFQFCTGLTSVTIPDSVTSIDTLAFGSCTNLTAINLSEGLTSIGNNAFRDCSSLTSITIPASVTSIGVFVFFGCAELVITVDANNLHFTSESGIVYNKAKTEIVAVPAGISGEITIPQGITAIGASVFTSCAGITSVTFPEGLISIGNQAFQSCYGITTSVTLPEGLTSLGNQVFQYCGSITGITLPSSLTSIGRWVFEYCTSITEITIPASVAEIGDDVFKGWTVEQTINVPFANAAAKPTGWNNSWNNDCNATIKYWNGSSYE